MKKFHLLDYDHDIQSVNQDRLYRTASEIALKYGSPGNSRLNYNHDYIREFWKYDDPYPSFEHFADHVRVSVVKWYIHNKMTVNYPLWNADFLHGLMAHCRIFWNQYCFPSCEWYNNDILTGLLRSCPFGGKIVQTKGSKRNRWIEVPALYLKHSEDSISFMAGVMAGIQVFKKDRINYGSFNERILPYFKQWGIPVEGRIAGNRCLVSPLWPALFIRHMPEGLIPNWPSIKKPYNANIYAPILWKTYMNSAFPVDGIPYLKSKRMIFYEFQCEEGAMEKLDKLRIEKNLTILDNRIKEVVQNWAKEIK